MNDENIIQNFFFVLSKVEPESDLHTVSSSATLYVRHISDIPSPVAFSRLLFPFSPLLSSVFCIMSPVFCLLSPISFPTSHVSCLPSPVYFLPSLVSRLLSNIYCLLSPVSHLLSPADKAGGERLGELTFWKTMGGCCPFYSTSDLYSLAVPNYVNKSPNNNLEGSRLNLSITIIESIFTALTNFYSVLYFTWLFKTCSSYRSLVAGGRRPGSGSGGGLIGGRQKRGGARKVG